MKERPYQLEVIQVPMQNGTLGYTVQAVCKAPLSNQHWADDAWHNAHTWPGSPQGHDDALLWAFDVQTRCGQGWMPRLPTWLLVACREADHRLPDAAVWAEWRKRTGRK